MLRARNTKKGVKKNDVIRKIFEQLGDMKSSYEIRLFHVKSQLIMYQGIYMEKAYPKVSIME